MLMHTQNEKSEDTEARFLLKIFTSPTLQFAVQEYFLLFTCCFRKIFGQQMNGVMGIFMER